jgi:hypothetical protein
MIYLVSTRYRMARRGKSRGVPCMSTRPRQAKAKARLYRRAEIHSNVWYEIGIYFLALLTLVGQVWSKKVVLGGRLQCARAAQLVKGGDITEKCDNLRIAAAEYFTGSIPGDGASSSAVSDLPANDAGRPLIWETQGGDTLRSAEYDNPNLSH